MPIYSISIRPYARRVLANKQDLGNEKLTLPANNLTVQLKKLFEELIELGFWGAGSSSNTILGITRPVYSNNKLLFKILVHPAYTREMILNDLLYPVYSSGWGVFKLKSKEYVLRYDNVHVAQYIRSDARNLKFVTPQVLIFNYS